MCCVHELEVPIFFRCQFIPSWFQWNLDINISKKVCKLKKKQTWSLFRRQKTQNSQHNTEEEE